MADVFVGTQSLDTTPPSVLNRVPAPGQPDVLVGAAVTFDVVDDPGGSGVDSATVTVTIEGANAILNGVVQAGYSGSLTPITDGFSVSVTPDAGLPQGTTIDITIDAADSATTPNVMTQVVYTFDTEIGDVDAPFVVNQIPAPSQTDVPFDTEIEFDLIDVIGAGTFSTGVDTNHITVTVDGNPAITNGVFQGSYTGTITAIDNGGKRVRVAPGELAFGGTVPITVDARDFANPQNIMPTVNYSFTVEAGDNQAPAVSNRHPQPSATQVPLTQPVTFDLKDVLGAGTRVDGVQLGSVVVRIDGADAIVAGVVQAGYTGSVTATDDGYEVSIAPNAGWTNNQTVTIEVDAYDGPLFFEENFDADWDGLPPDPQFNPPDLSFTEQFDASWDGVP